MVKIPPSGTSTCCIENYVLVVLIPEGSWAATTQDSKPRVRTTKRVCREIVVDECIPPSERENPWGGYVNLSPSIIIVEFSIHLRREALTTKNNRRVNPVGGYANRVVYEDRGADKRHGYEEGEENEK